MMSSPEIAKISIIIPVHNEENFLPKCLSAIDRASSQITNPIEIIVVLNRCTDRSEEIAKIAKCLTITNDTKNLSAIRNAGIKIASGEILVTIDADSMMSENLLKKIVETISSGKYIGGGANIIPDRISLGIICSMLALSPFLIIWGITAGVFYARREDLLKIGGFNETLFSAEDIDLALRLKKLGKSQGKKYKNLLTAYIITSSRKFDRFGDWYAFRHPWLMLKLLKGRQSQEANKIWYDFNN